MRYMKYLRTHEAFFEEPKYNIGDYVVVKDHFDKKYFAKIKAYNKLAKVYQVDLFWHHTESFLFSDDKVLRKMTPEEIEKLKMKQNINKYNL